MNMSTELMLNGIHIREIVIGIECDVEGVTSHVISDGLLIFIGEFNSLSNINIMFEELFNINALPIKYRNARIIAFETSYYFLKKYKRLMKNSKLSFVNRDISIQKIAHNVFFGSLTSVYSSGFDAIGFFDIDFNMIKEPRIGNKCIYVLNDIRNIEYSNMDKAYEISAFKM